MWLKSSAEMSFLYGNNVLRSGIAKMTDDAPQHGGVVVFSSWDVPLGLNLSVI